MSGNVVRPMGQDTELRCDAGEYGSVAAIGDFGCRCLVCSRCGHHTGNSSQGHFWAMCKVTRTRRDFHFCCPDRAYGCELEEGDGDDRQDPSD